MISVTFFITCTISLYAIASISESVSRYYMLLRLSIGSYVAFKNTKNSKIFTNYLSSPAKDKHKKGKEQRKKFYKMVPHSDIKEKLI